MNQFLLLGGLLPQPWLDGGVVLKWALVARGQSLKKADKAVQVANAAAAVGLGTASAAVFKQRKKFWGWFLGVMAALSVGAATGWLKEKAE
jgi:hypothetical protein